MLGEGLFYIFSSDIFNILLFTYYYDFKKSARLFGFRVYLLYCPSRGLGFPFRKWETPGSPHLVPLGTARADRGPDPTSRLPSPLRMAPPRPHGSQAPPNYPPWPRSAGHTAGGVSRKVVLPSFRAERTRMRRSHWWSCRFDPPTG